MNALLMCTYMIYVLLVRLRMSFTITICIVLTFNINIKCIAFPQEKVHAKFPRYQGKYIWLIDIR